MRYNIPLHLALRDITLHYIRQHKIRLRKHTCHIFTMYMCIYIYTQLYMCMCFFWPPPPPPKKTRGAGQFSKKNATRSASPPPLFPQPGIMDFRGEAPPPASKIDSSGRLLINLVVFLTKHPGFQLLMVDVIGNKNTLEKNTTFDKWEKNIVMNEDVYISDISYEKNLDLFIVFSGKFLQFFWSPHGCDHPGPAASTVLRGDASPPTEAWREMSLRQLRLVVEIPVFTSGFIHPRWVRWVVVSDF